jgi:hypothetical protein
MRSTAPSIELTPSGNDSIAELAVGIAIVGVLASMSGCTQPLQTKFVTVKQVAYEQQENGLHIALGAYTKSLLPQFSEYNWIQWVTTNAIQPQFKNYEQGASLFSTLRAPAAFRRFSM